MKTRRSKGLTLIELMVTVAILAIIAAVAYPSFTDGLRKSRRAEAMKGLLSMQLKQEEYRIANLQYVNPTVFNATPALLGSPTSDYYTFTVSAATAVDYTLVATSKGAQVGDKAGNTACDTLTINKADIKTPAECW